MVIKEGSEIKCVKDGYSKDLLCDGKVLRDIEFDGKSSSVCIDDKTFKINKVEKINEFSYILYGDFSMTFEDVANIIMISILCSICFVISSYIIFNPKSIFEIFKGF